jgi:hypothetical protein
MSMQRHTDVQTLTIANGATTSDFCNAAMWAMFGLIMPAAFTGTTLTFTVCNTPAGTYQALYDVSNATVSLTVAVSRSYDLPAELSAWPYFKIVSGSAEGAARSLIIVKKG